jgi:hypothetical protein
MQIIVYNKYSSFRMRVGTDSTTYTKIREIHVITTIYVSYIKRYLAENYISRFLSFFSLLPDLDLPTIDFVIIYE